MLSIGLLWCTMLAAVLLLIVISLCRACCLVMTGSPCERVARYREKVQRRKFAITQGL